jgi:hypothetical protein
MLHCKIQALQFVLLQIREQHHPDDDDVPARLPYVHSTFPTVHLVTGSLHVVPGQV